MRQLFTTEFINRTFIHLHLNKNKYKKYFDVLCLKKTCIHSLTSVNTPCNLWQGKKKFRRHIQTAPRSTKVVKYTIMIAVFPAASDHAKYGKF